MMRSPDSQLLFIEVPRTGSTALKSHLRDRGGWAQVPALQGVRGRHSPLLQPYRGYAFGVRRNPWDRMASWWRLSAPGTTSFISYLMEGRHKIAGVDILRFTQVQWLQYTDDQLRYETLEEDWQRLCARVQHFEFVSYETKSELPPGPIPLRNVSKDKREPEWTAKEIDVVAQRFAEDIERWGYTGPGCKGADS